MKSIKNEGTVRCPRHCEPFDAEYWSLVSADQDPDLKTAVLGGELNLVRCPECGTFFHHDGELIYFDAPAELLVFVFSEKDRAKESELLARMREDYNIIKNTLLKQLNMDYPPVSAFGLEAVAAAAASLEFSVARLKPSYARQHHFPFYVPAPAQDRSANGFAVAAAKVLKSGLASTLLRHFEDKMGEDGADAPILL